MTVEIKRVAAEFKIGGNIIGVDKIEIGHINTTYHILTDGEDDYILQRINTNIFKDPYKLTENILAVTSFLGEKIVKNSGNIKRETLTLIETRTGGHLYDTDSGHYRMYIFIKEATSYNTAIRPVLFHNAAVAFGRFQKLLNDFPAERLHETIKNFHNTQSRYNDFCASVEKNISGRADTVKEEIAFIKQRAGFCSLIMDKINSGLIPLRVTHNDTKLNNIMIDNKTDEGVCVIDLDTVMPGSVLYDFGDSIRFGASSAAEDEKDLDKVYMSLSLFEEFAKGFLSEARDTLTDEETEMLPIGVVMMTLECGMRFLADYIDGDKYFALHYEGQNLDRARTQLKLVADMEVKLPEMKRIVKKYSK
ncbi:MAG: mucin desulfatase [Firmicutes bacterium HGW-Firmicutes-21]|nr:MAG: mucin desulfatase [Firmicutes bacterium HGW-Firmicutes-21]